MRYLLDTHAILWYVDAAKELPLAVRDTVWIAAENALRRSAWGVPGFSEPPPR